MLKTIILSLFVSLNAFAATNDCPADQVIGAGFVANRFDTVAYGCMVQVTPQQKPDMLYREYWLDERGRFMVFVSVPGDDLDQATGTRTYFLFPRQTTPVLLLAQNGDLTVSLGAGEAVFAAKTAQLQSLPGQIQVASQISLENQGGLEITSFKGLVMDAGWKVGTQSYKDPAGLSVFTDAGNHKCQIKNDEFFFYENMYYGEPNLKYPDDASLAEFLKTRCPNLDLSPLKPEA